MIAKKYRLPEREWRKVLRQKKPFFSYLYSARVQKNRLWYARVGIVLSGKVTRGSVNRNFFRRRFYDLACEILDSSYDIIVLPKKWVILSHKNPQDIAEFDLQIATLFDRILPSSSLCKKH